jgi:Xaa-Pro aminopeptidase
MNALVEVSPYVNRRQRLFTAIGDNIAILPTAHEVARNRDTDYLYRHDSYFYYLTGFKEPEAVLVMLGGNEKKAILFCREKNLEREIWDGYRYGPDSAREIFQFDEAYPIEKFKEMLPALMSNRSAVYSPVGMSAEWDATISEGINAVRALARTGVGAPSSVIDAHAVVDDMRLIKDAHEIAIMRRAAEISSLAHARAMKTARPGQYEYHVEAELMHEFVRNGSRAPAYNHIVASGPNACVLHYNDSNRLMKDGDLLLIDAGCEYEGYASDITRTFPVNGKFTGPQKDVYEAVLKAQYACMDVLKAGNAFHKYHDVATESLAQSMLDLGLLKGSLAQVLEEKTYMKFYMHRAGHWIGMDVHDAGAYRVKGESQMLRAGMVVTNEPGLYIRPDADVPEHFWNIGVRIEDDVLITATGNDNLTIKTPKTVAEVEAACAR